MNKFILFLLFYLNLNAYFWDIKTAVTLKKDEVAKYSVSSRIFGRKELTFRWTLYRPNQLTLLLNYDKHPMQVVLNQNDMNRNFFRLYLYPNNRLKYILIKFTSIEDGLVLFNIYIKDNSDIITGGRDKKVGE